MACRTVIRGRKRYGDLCLRIAAWFGGVGDCMVQYLCTLALELISLEFES